MLWYPGVDRPLMSFMEESSFRMSRLSFRLLLAVLAALHFVFLLGILVGNFILSFLLFSWSRDRETELAQSFRHWNTWDPKQTMIKGC